MYVTIYLPIHRRIYLITINKDIVATSPAGMNAPPDKYRLPITPANIAETTRDKMKFDGFWET